jgi:hypothetical protein
MCGGCRGGWREYYISSMLHALGMGVAQIISVYFSSCWQALHLFVHEYCQQLSR